MPSSLRSLGDPNTDSDDVVILDGDDFSDFNEFNILPQKKHSISHLAGNWGWLFSSDTYLKWHSSQEDGVLWIREIPGSGKSVFAANLINQLNKKHHSVL
ncbi:hypothetical protein TWF569_008623 [Orbilia oligospora]|uniref:Nephrocystin 3-like N-terminal domain-containing protein n=1 Tax=Orbilia oligospora TaxID=2813651 RepID=A0A7C8JDY3_ORBOL|nr:hypothetical protein TWF706_004586 [Orbilia oligospora]KAF3113531.1 hypothetical protein TWF102_000186 [Orbilia oligospora]KAF3115285.1 hypothetical protein TWF103_011542 [Orbilia oligospora]KAF3138929.1 hypothetical protein TWF569_008623 [Orbilia oligospora]